MSVGLKRAFRKRSALPLPAIGCRRVREEAVGDTKVGRCAAGTPLRLGGNTYKRGIGVNSHCILRVVLARPAARFVADVGLDRNVDGTPGSSAFHVVVGGKDMFATKVLRPADGVQKIDVPLGGARQFDLVVDDGGDGRSYDQGDWADARVILEDGTAVWLDEMPSYQQSDCGVPFSFLYGGRHSSELLTKWKRTVTSESIGAGRQRRTLTLTDPETGLEVRAEATVYLDTPCVEWTLYFTNKGQKDTPILENIKAIDATVAMGVSQGLKLLRLVGSPCRVDDWLPLEDAVQPGTRIAFATVGGRSSSGASPFFNLQWPGGGVITAIGWSGQWAANVEYGKDGAVNLSAGLETTHLKLHPGEAIRSPRIMQLYWLGRRSVARIQPVPPRDVCSRHAEDRRPTCCSTDRAFEHLVLRVERQHRSECAFALGSDQGSGLRGVLA